ncbi:MarR family winged helix-turn-helix transcriptional regulator [Paenibacillus segetis]|uniref:HTH marR-type domain-containing protein n=1 Tax=Paenibacillus segetis TaxID=1325360 RepID=A0ABQ1Y4I5_9BACL|nr:MarR family transcriptional regulator [Paenibacillus segetis]GGH12368.1 hypothetical protein GCM10008013_04780 [Paenibacillus segetis]
MKNEDWILQEEADWLFRKVVRRFVKERDKITIEGISLPGVLMLNIINQDGAQRLGDLAEQLDFTSGAVTALCDKLEEGGFAIRKRSEGDRRTIVLEVTDEGKEMLQRNNNIGICSITTLFEGFSIKELSDQISYYRRMIDNIEGFSTRMLALAKQNTERSEQAENNSSEGEKRKSGRFVGY